MIINKFYNEVMNKIERFENMMKMRAMNDNCTVEQSEKDQNCKLQFPQPDF